MAFELRDYQRPIVQAAVDAIAAGETEVLIAACPGAGKTEVAFEILRVLVDRGVIRNALMLAWLRNDLKKQTIDRLEDRAPGLSSHLRIEIPQQRQNISGTFDLLIQDEAHQAYEVESGMVQDIRTRVKAKSTLLLTGSPSRLIRRGLKPVSVFALEDLHLAGHAADLTIEIGTSTYDITDSDYTRQGDVRRGRFYSQAATDETLDNLLDSLYSRLRLGRHSMNWWNRAILKTVEKGWNPILTALRKSIIACRDIDQAEQVGGYLRRRGVTALVSHSRNDVDAKLVDGFAASDATTLVVVDRAQLGYDNPGLVNFVDMTGSRNPDRIFQMMCRVIRRSDAVAKKLFVKVMPTSFSDSKLLYFMEGVLNLSRREIFQSYKGDWANLIVPTKVRTASNDNSATKGTRRTGARGPSRQSPVLEAGMSLYGPTGYMAALSHTNAAGYEPIGQVRLCDAIAADFTYVLPMESQVGRLLRELKDISRRTDQNDWTRRYDRNSDAGLAWRRERERDARRIVMKIDALVSDAKEAELRSKWFDALSRVAQHWDELDRLLWNRFDDGVLRYPKPTIGINYHSSLPDDVKSYIDPRAIAAHPDISAVSAMVGDLEQATSEADLLYAAAREIDFDLLHVCGDEIGWVAEYGYEMPDPGDSSDWRVHWKPIREAVDLFRARSMVRDDARAVREVGMAASL